MQNINEILHELFSPLDTKCGPKLSTSGEQIRQKQQCFLRLLNMNVFCVCLPDVNENISYL